MLFTNFELYFGNLNQLKLEFKLWEKVIGTFWKMLNLTTCLITQFSLGNEVLQGYFPSFFVQPLQGYELGGDQMVETNLVGVLFNLEKT